MIIAALLLGQLGSSDIDSRVATLLSLMTLQEKVSLVHGKGDMDTADIPRLGVRSWHFTDGPHGVRIPWEQQATYFPTGVSMAATWNPELIGEVGKALADETLAKGSQVLLGPAVNIVRTPVGGRSFEYMGEDPFLAGRTAVSYIKGVQSKGVVACVKHFAANSIENQRGTVSAEIDERTLHEIYLPAFEDAVKEGKVGSVMAAYNKINGVYCAENKHLLTDILKNQWGFQGFVMSDWGAVHSTVPTALDGLDLEMPGSNDNLLAGPLEAAVKKGEVPEARLNDMAGRMLRTLMKADVVASMAPHYALNSPAHQNLAQRVAEQAMVLLKNEQHLLPLNESKIKTLAVIGPNADAGMAWGGGSSAINPPYEITPLAGIRSRFGSKVDVRYLLGADPNFGKENPIPAEALQTSSGAQGLAAEYFANDHWEGAPAFLRTDRQIDFNWNQTSPDSKISRNHFSVRWTGTIRPTETADYLIGTSSDDGSDITLDGKQIVNNLGPHGVQSVYARVHMVAGMSYPVVVRYSQIEGDAVMKLFWEKIPLGTPVWIRDSVAAAKAADAVVLVLGTNHSYDSEGGDKPDLQLPGDQDSLAEKVLAANPNTVVVLVNGSALEMPWIAKAKAVLEAWYGGERAGNAVSRILFGDVNPSGKLPITMPRTLAQSPAHANGDYPPKDDKIRYDEGILVGYRYFDTRHVEPLFPFGHGLSYTTFQYSDLRLLNQGANGVLLRLKLKNSGKRLGMETVQVYIRPKNPRVMRPFQELKGFSKVQLKPGQTLEVKIQLPKAAFAYYSVEKGRWKVDPGQYDIAVGSSSRDIRLTKSVSIK